MGSISDYVALLERIWAAQNYTNNGPLVRQLEQQFREQLSIRFPVVVNNGTIALHLALRILDLKGCDILTTPFTWISSSSSILWEHCNPIFVDIEPNTFNIDSKRLSDSLTPNTKAILAVHVFSNPCDVVEIERFAQENNLNVIYDAAHAFGVAVNGKNIYEWGDVSTASFHATKVFNTVEGGAIICSSEELYERARSIRDFGYSRERNIEALGINAKMSELHAAIGILNLPLYSEAVNRRKKLTEAYRQILQHQVAYQSYDESSYNYSYMPIVLPSEEILCRVVDALQSINVFPRRYFYPSLSHIDKLFPNQPCPIAEDISRRILCLPLYPALEVKEVEVIAQKILEVVVY